MTVPEEQSTAASEIPQEELRLLAGVEPRIMRSIIALAVIGTIVLWLWRGMAWGGGFAVGGALSALSFRWMTEAIHALAERAIAGSAAGAASGPASETPSAPAQRRSTGTVWRFVLRYALIGIAGYVIFRSSAVSLPAFFVGLFVSIAAVLGEIGYQIYLSFGRN
jgi:ATP synthase I subunit